MEFLLCGDHQRTPRQDIGYVDFAVSQSGHYNFVIALGGDAQASFPALQSDE